MTPPNLFLPWITVLENPEKPPGTNQYDCPDTSQMMCTVLATGISVHNFVRHNKDTRWPQIMVPGLDDLPPSSSNIHCPLPFAQQEGLSEILSPYQCCSGIEN